MAQSHPKMRSRWASSLLLTAALIAAALVVPKLPHRLAHGSIPYREPAPAGAQESRIRDLFLSGQSAEVRFEQLFQYFAAGFVQHAVPGYARVNYKGASSQNGFDVDGLEGFSRTATLLAAWLYSGRSTMVPAPDAGPALNITDMLRSGILRGVDPASPDYWGDAQPYDQRIVEAADVARVLWLTRHVIWTTLTDAQRQEVRAWLSKAANQATPHSNWMLFPVVINLTLASLGDETERPRLKNRAHEIYSQYKRLYLDHGWFRDPPQGVDFYNTWGIPYDLFWIHTLDPSFDPQFIADALRQSAELTQYLLGPKGIPIMGRSVCYRTAVPVPLIAASLLGEQPFSSAKALRALDVVWQYFIAHGSLRDGALTQGYFTADLRLLDMYSGTGSCHWGLRSMVLAFLHPAGDPFWQIPEQPLPIETADYHLELGRLGWRVDGNQASGNIVITVLKNTALSIRIEDQSWRMKLTQILLGKPVRPHNREVKYDSRYFSATAPFPLQ
jgi:hypothetical protein